MTTAQILRDAAALVEKGWTQGCAAREIDGVFTGFSSGKASCWCVSGAIARAIYDLGGDVGSRSSVYPYLWTAIGTKFQAGWNDSPDRTQAEVVAALLRAAELAEAGGAL
jgi:hypothetical protein